MREDSYSCSGLALTSGCSWFYAICYFKNHLLCMHSPNFYCPPAVSGGGQRLVRLPFADQLAGNVLGILLAELGHLGDLWAELGRVSPCGPFFWLLFQPPGPRLPSPSLSCVPGFPVWSAPSLNCTKEIS